MTGIVLWCGVMLSWVTNTLASFSHHCLHCCLLLLLWWLWLVWLILKFLHKPLTTGCPKLSRVGFCVLKLKYYLISGSIRSRCLLVWVWETWLLSQRESINGDMEWVVSETYCDNDVITRPTHTILTCKFYIHNLFCKHLTQIVPFIFYQNYVKKCLKKCWTRGFHGLTLPQAAQNFASSNNLRLKYSDIIIFNGS